MSAGLLRDAVEAIREDQPGRDEAEQEFYLAVAEWLDYMAEQAARLDELRVAQEDRSKQQRQALIVARAYLGRDA